MKDGWSCVLLRDACVRRRVHEVGESLVCEFGVSDSNAWAKS